MSTDFLPWTVQAKPRPPVPPAIGHGWGTIPGAWFATQGQAESWIREFKDKFPALHLRARKQR